MLGLSRLLWYSRLFRRFLQSGLTVPFIARYRRDCIGGCSEEVRFPAVFFDVCASMHASLAHFMQNLRDVAKSLEAVEKLNKLKIKTISALHAIPSLPYRVLNDVVAAVDSDDVKEIAGQFITKATPPLPYSLLCI